MSFFQRFSADAKNSCTDLYSNWILGDDAGKSARLTLILRPTHLPLRASKTVIARIDLGMTFLEINGRAYVKSVAPGSAAARAGIMPQDAVQYATLVREEWLTKKEIKSYDGGLNSEPNDQNHDDILADDATDTIATKNILEMEAKGLRISYDELRKLLAEALDPTQAAFLSPPVGSRIAPLSAWNGPPIPSTVKICVPVEHRNNGEGGPEGDEDDVGFGLNRPNSPFVADMPRPVVFCFRRTRQRKSIHHLGMPCFRLDDECDFASSLVKRLAPTSDMEIPPPDTWEELVHDGTDWLLGRGSMLPPKMGMGGAGMLLSNQNHYPGYGVNHYYNRNSNMIKEEEDQAANNAPTASPDDEEDLAIPLDEFERIRQQKLAQLRSRMAAEAMQVDRSEDVEAVTIRGMIQKAVGLAFVKASKVVLGVSIHIGSGIVIARLSDGTWSAPAAIGTWGLGLGIQFGLEVAEYIFILQTQEALDHFKRGGSFTIGGNMGMAVAGVGREAYGAASVSGGCGTTSVVKDDEYNDNDSREQRHQHQSVAVAPIVAYAKSQGLYVGVSLEGSRIYSRDDINSRTYKFQCGRDVSANDILCGKVPTPREAEELYAALHSVEFTHEMSCLPRPPEILRADSANAWFYDRSTLGEPYSQSLASAKSKEPFTFLSSMSPEEAEECQAFETQFKNFMYGGVSVQRLLPDTDSRSGRTGKERRTLWLMLPEVGSLRLGFVSKLSDGEGAVSNKSSTQRSRRDDPSRISNFDGDVGTVGSEDVTLDSALNTRVSYEYTFCALLPSDSKTHPILNHKRTAPLSDTYEQEMCSFRPGTL